MPPIYLKRKGINMPMSRGLWESITGSDSDKKQKKEKVEEPKKEKKEGMLDKLNKALKTPPGGY